MHVLEQLLGRCSTKAEIELAIELTNRTLTEVRKSKTAFEGLIKVRSSDVVFLDYNRTIEQIVTGNKLFLDFNEEYLKRLQTKLQTI